MSKALGTWLFLSVGCLANAAGFDFELVETGAGSGHILLAASFDGAQKKCILDTGGRASIVKLAPEFELYPIVGTATTTGITGNEVSVDLIKIGALTFGDLAFENQVVRRQDGFPYECLIGNDLLKNESLFFDFQNSKLVADRVADGEALTLTRFPGDWVGFPVSFGGPSVDAIWDTGAGLTLVDPKVVEAAPSNFVFVQETPVFDGTGTKVMAKVYQMKSLQFGVKTVQDILVVAYSLEKFQTEVPSVQVVLGFNILRKFNWSIDNVNNKWRAESF